MKRKNARAGVLSIAIPIVILIAGFWVLTEYGSVLGLDSEVANGFITLLPGIALIAVGIITLYKMSGPMLTMSGFTLGLGFAYIFGVLDTLGILTTQILSGLLLWQVQLIIILVFSIGGLIISHD